MNVYISKTDNLSMITNYFSYNSLNFEIKDFWNNTTNLHMIGACIDYKPSLVIVNYETFLDTIRNAVSKNDLLKLLEHGSKLWVWNDIDGGVCLLNSRNLVFDFVNPLTNKDSIHFFIDCEMTIDLPGINFSKFPYNFFFSSPRIIHALDSKINPTYDFLLLTVLKNTSPHRHLLKQKLEQRPNLSSHGLIRFSPKKQYDSWLGQTQSSQSWHDGVPSMDLYRDCWIEIVPETKYCDAHFFTEKTCKPIATRTPFLILSTAGFLTYLRSLGFRTFDSLIDESYDNETDLDKRTDKLLEVLQNIIDQGSKNFYEAAKPILEHNQKKLFEISGSKQYYMDIFINYHLQTRIINENFYQK